jgi:antirestriction protein ArdC
MGMTDRDRLLEALAEGVESLGDSDAWRAHLELQGRFHRYSFNNTVLIGSQCPDATRIAGFAAWKKLGRSVVRGERAIWILAPITGRRNRTDEGEERRPIIGFRPVAVFDVSQTEGDELPEVCRVLEGDDPDGCFESLILRAARAGYSVELAELPGGANGDCTFSRRRIRVESRNRPAQRVKTLAHELAHALLHEGDVDRPTAELEAEATAYVVCRALGLDTADYSFGYVASWAGGGVAAASAISASGAAIQRAVAFLLDDPGRAVEAAVA